MTTNSLSAGDPPTPRGREPYRHYNLETTPEEFTRVLALLADLRAAKDWLEGNGGSDGWDERIHARAKGVDGEEPWVEFGYPEPQRYRGGGAVARLARESGIVARTFHGLGPCPLTVWQHRPMHAVQLDAPGVENRYLLVSEETSATGFRKHEDIEWRGNPLLEPLDETETLSLGIYRLPPAKPGTRSDDGLDETDLHLLGRDKVWLTDRILEEVIFPYKSRAE